MAAQQSSADAERRLDPYVPRVLLRHLAQTPDARVMSIDATVVFADISGFTALSERLARQGREGAEELTETIGGSLSALLTVAYENGGSLLTLGGDALLLLFEHEGHAAARVPRRRRHAQHAARRSGGCRPAAGRVTLRVSQGVHSGTFHLFLVGDSHRAHMLVGPAASTVVRMEKAADAGEILISARDRGAAPGALRRARRRARGCCSRPRRRARGAVGRAAVHAALARGDRRSACRRWCARTSSRAASRPSIAT